MGHLRFRWESFPQTWFCQAEKPHPDNLEPRFLPPWQLQVSGVTTPPAWTQTLSRVFLWNAGHAGALAHSCPPACNAQSRCFSKHLTEHDCRALVGSEPTRRGLEAGRARVPLLSCPRRLCSASPGAGMAQRQRPGGHWYPLPFASHPAQGVPTLVSPEWLVLIQGL